MYIQQGDSPIIPREWW